MTTLADDLSHGWLLFESVDARDGWWRGTTTDPGAWIGSGPMRHLPCGSIQTKAQLNHARHAATQQRPAERRYRLPASRTIKGLRNIAERTAHEVMTRLRQTRAERFCPLRACVLVGSKPRSTGFRNCMQRLSNVHPKSSPSRHCMHIASRCHALYQGRSFVYRTKHDHR
ncbi:hypothetical protein STRNTR1_2168 [Stenotrophomonas maltophilia]|nr:hypothetical protein STRNTR1_2168 [Stenotrophomonas maltophilia]